MSVALGPSGALQYEGALKRLPGWQASASTYRSSNDGQEFTLLLYLAHAYYVQGMSEKDLRALHQAELHLERVRRSYLPRSGRTALSLNSSLGRGNA